MGTTGWVVTVHTAVGTCRNCVTNIIAVRACIATLCPNIATCLKILKSVFLKEKLFQCISSSVVGGSKIVFGCSVIKFFHSLLCVIGNVSV